MNYKLEKFWNGFAFLAGDVDKIMNYKLEKFWNKGMVGNTRDRSPWTINLKSFEIHLNNNYHPPTTPWTINLKSFEINL